MISVLIPIHNKQVLSLVKDVSNQLSNSNILYEIICLDDASKKEIKEANIGLNQYPKVIYHTNKINLGRVKTRQRLAELSTFDWLLFLDSDIEIKHKDFINHYISVMSQPYDAFFGGFSYKSAQPEVGYELRWRYGHSQEEVAANTRNKSPYKVIISGNFLVKKDIFIKINGQIPYNGYGYDLYFGTLLKQYQIKIRHIDNEVYHLGIERNEDYLKKIEEAISNLLNLKRSGAIRNHENSLLKAFLLSKNTGLSHLFSAGFKVFQSALKKHLTGSNPSVILLQLYKLGYMCHQANR